MSTEASFLVVAAVAAELEGLEGAVLGVGVLPAAIATARLCALRPPRAIVLVGTAGSYGRYAIGSVVTARTVGLVSGTATVGAGYVPLSPPALATQIRARLPEVDVATLMAITTDARLAERVGESWQIEHMEAYGVAAAAAAAGIPFGAVFGITNQVGPNAHAEWRANREHCQAAAVAEVARLLSGR